MELCGIPYRRIVLYITAFCLGFIAVSLWSFWLALHPRKIDSGFTPERFGLPYESLRLRSLDWVEIAGWYIPAATRTARAPALVILHGYPAEKGDMLSIAADLHDDFNLLLIDLRSFGASGGRMTTLGKREVLDLAAAVDELERRGHDRIGVLGFSLGGAVAIMAAAADPRIQAVAAYAAFADLELLGQDAYRRLPLLKYPLVELMRLWARVFLDYDVTVESPRAAAGRLEIPLLLIHQRADDQIPFRHAELLRQSLAANPQAEFYFPERGGHGEFPADFGARLKAFFALLAPGRR